MLTSSSVAQYINPDYLQPLPTTLDAKKSPLALLAQTCSSIGKDTNSKSLIPPLDKKDSEKNNDKSNNDGHKRETKDKESSSNSKPGFRTIQSKDIPPLVPVSRSSEDQKTPSPSPSKSSPRPPKEKTCSPQADLTSGPPRSISSHSSGSHRNMTDKDDDKSKRPGSSPRSPHKFTRDIGSYGDVAKSVCSTSQSAYSGYSSLSSSYPHYTHAGHGLSPDAAAAHFAGFPLPLPAHGAFGSSSAAAAALAAQSSALAAQSSALKAGMGSSFSPYVTYARVRTPSGATTLVPVCRDPYCTHCQLTEQNAHLSSTCTAVGCAQCAHEKSLQNLSLGLNSSSFSHLQSLSASGLLTSVPSSSLHLSSPLYHHSALSGHTQSAFPFACNWVSAGNEHCGKRFTTSEELLQHLRTHTTASDPLSLAASYDRYGLAAAAAAGLPGLHLPTPGSVSPNSLRRSYPTSLSPLSGLMGSSRYHPYKTMINPQAGLSNAQHHPGLSPYLSHYSLYGQRLGAAAVP
ncbi:zinc finger protein Noc-like [Mizuhopecten yessoensis]|uniref:Zinc finger protein 503 n=1 Tax=Mizuhopecten yessoensis TaxID=6573 RepID=A0A210QMR3_MIZYE|nr:zinc finger protein Noc-like [Mizuhopecten yessoensis]OWF50016.1 Zinc finger protein 503 [Mizuhopecten yessoensis]